MCYTSILYTEQLYTGFLGCSPIFALEMNVDCSTAYTTAALLCRIPLPRGNGSSNREPAYVDWLYLDDDLRVTQGSKGSLFVHTRS